MRDLFALFDTYSVRYLLVGGHAAIIHGNPRVTGDTDIFYDRAADNCERLFSALSDFWGGDIPVLETPSELAEPGAITQFGRPPNRLDLINQIDGVDFPSAWDGRASFQLKVRGRDVPLHILNRSDFLLNKRASGRPKDLDDVNALE